jgi:hypothetical protein
MANTYTWRFPLVEYIDDGDVTNSIKRIAYRVDVSNESDTEDTWMTHIMGVTEVTDNSLSFDTATFADCKATVLADLGMTESDVETKLDTMKSTSYSRGEVSE